MPDKTENDEEDNVRRVRPVVFLIQWRADRMGPLWSPQIYK